MTLSTSNLFSTRCSSIRLDNTKDISSWFCYSSERVKDLREYKEATLSHKPKNSPAFPGRWKTPTCSRSNQVLPQQKKKPCLCPRHMIAPAVLICRGTIQVMNNRYFFFFWLASPTLFQTLQALSLKILYAAFTAATLDLDFGNDTLTK